MPTRTLRRSAVWTVGAHTIGGLLLGTAEALRLHSAALAAVVIPLCGMVGLLAGVAVALCDHGGARLRRRLGPASLAAELLAALVLALPSVIVTLPVATALFAGAYASTLPLAGLMPVLLPVVACLLIAATSILGRALVTDGDLTGRSIGILGVATLLGGVFWAKHHLLGTGYEGAQVGGMIAAIVLAGIAVRIAWHGRLSARASLAMAGLVVLVAGAAVAAAVTGLASAGDRRLLAERGDLGRDVVHLVRGVRDHDRDGASRWLGGGDCDDGDPARHPGAADVPGDGIDQDCDGADAAVVHPTPRPAATRVAETAWSSTPAVRALLASTARMNVLLVSVDALRFDLLAPGAEHRDDFPHLAALLDRSVQFTRAIAPAAGTDVALSTLLTGRFDPFQTIERTLPEAMKLLGRHTAVAMPAEVTRNVGDVLIGRGFESVKLVYTDWDHANVGDHISGPTTTAEGIRAIDKAGTRPWFTWVHYFDVHEHHQLTVPGDLLAATWPGANERVHKYRALVLQADRSVGRLLDELTARGQADTTIIVFVADHGEALGEDPRLPDTHGQFVYPSLIRIPFAVQVPGVPGGLRTDPVSLVDLAPTLLDLLGGRDTITPLDGMSLVPALLAGPAALRPPKDRAIVVHEEKQQAVVEWPYELIVRPEDDLVELYDLELDPTAQHDLAAAEPKVIARLKARYAEVPAVRIDRTSAGRADRERRAQPPRPRVPS